MHELVIVEGILETVIPEVQKHNVSKILKIRLKIGDLSGVVPRCVHEYFDIAAAGTIAEGAKLEIESIPVRIRCSTCGYDGVLGKVRYLCPSCGGTDFRITQGKEYYIENVEAE